MKAMIFAAGLGTRLRPITDNKPKALVEYKGRPLLDLVMDRLLAAGASEVIINLHHFPEQIRKFVAARNHYGIRVEFSPEEKLLDTGGGLKQAAPFFDDGQPFLLHNVDIVSNIDLQAMLAAHRERDALATLAAKQRPTSRYLLFDEHDLLCGWRSLVEGRIVHAREPKGSVRELGFCGIHVISPHIFDLLSEEGAFPIIEAYLRLAADGQQLRLFSADNCEWRDIGKLAELS